MSFLKSLSADRLPKTTFMKRLMGQMIGLLPDHEIARLAKEQGMVDRFIDHPVRGNGVMSYGASSYAYDARVADEWKIFTDVDCAVVDPKNFDERVFAVRQQDVCIIPARSFVLARTVEYFKIPRDVIAICLGKSSYARCGIIVNPTVLQPEWEGHVTLEFSNTAPIPAKIYANEGACQFIFLRASPLLTCALSYADLKGKYMGQTGVTGPLNNK